MKLGGEFYPLKSLRSNQNMVFSSKNLKLLVISREYSHLIQTATYPPFTKGTMCMMRVAWRLDRHPAANVQLIMVATSMSMDKASSGAICFTMWHGTTT